MIYQHTLLAGLVLLSLAAAARSAAPAATPAGTTVAATLTGGHDTDPRDKGRPVALVAAGLGVTPDVFREAFSRVTPAPGGREPEPQQVQANKRALLDALAKYGVTNQRLDEVSDYYRYPPGNRNLWKHVDAVVKANEANGKVTGFEIEKPGAGYTTPPAVAVAGFPNLKVKVTLAFGKDLAKNGSIAAITLDETK